MTSTALNLSHTSRFEVAAYAGRNDGTGTADMLNLTVAVRFRANTSAGDVRYAREAIGRWLSQYLDGHDANAALDFAPTLDRIAAYLLAVFEQFLGVVASVEVQDGPDSVLVSRS